MTATPPFFLRMCIEFLRLGYFELGDLCIDISLTKDEMQETLQNNMSGSLCPTAL